MKLANCCLAKEPICFRRSPNVLIASLSESTQIAKQAIGKSQRWNNLEFAPLAQNANNDILREGMENGGSFHN